MAQSESFPCKIHNTDDRDGLNPTYAILSMEPGFDLDSGIARVKETPPKNIFILINGQLAGHNQVGD